MQHYTKGSSVILVLIFSAVFLMLTTSLTGYLFAQQRLHLLKENQERALQIAEAGLDYYKWFLAHHPDDLTDGTGAPGPYVHTYADPEGDDIGSFSLDINGNELCNAVTAIDITSTGWSNNDPSVRRSVFGRYSRPSVAEYAYILNSNVWAGEDRTIIGPYHSNGGIRMDADNRSTVTSAVSSWQCTSTFGCSPTSQQNGIFGIGDHPELWSYPVPTIDFAGITVDLAAMRDVARSMGLYFNPYGGVPDHVGYRMVFKVDGTVDVYRVTNTTAVRSYSLVTLTWGDEYHLIQNQNFMGNYQIPANCPVIFAESKVWVEGVVNGKITLAAARLSNPNVSLDVILNGNLTYESNDGSDGITIVAQRSVLIPLVSPENLTLQGIFIAQNGAFGRNHYITTNGSDDVPEAYNSYVQQGTLGLTGTIVSNGREGTKWTNGATFVSGYNVRNNSYDRNLATNPPPLTPFVSNDYRFIEWLEE